MRFFTLFLFVLIFVHFTYGQPPILINFEEIPNDNPSEGLILDGQFLDEFGISFSIEGGGNPVLAEIGSPATAFESSFGDDTPAPDQEIGRFFLTDDGNLSGLESPPLLITADSPLQFIGGVILDIDFGEVFTLEAFDGDGNLLQTIVLDANNPDAGDGIATPWRFEVNNCAGIRSVRIDGEREREGVFGLGVDNIEFQYLESSPGEQIAVSTRNATCDLENGTIQLQNNGPQMVNYSLDGIDYLAVDSFPNLSEGSYSVFLRSEIGCLDTLSVMVIETTVIDDCGVCLEPEDPAFNQSCADCTGTPNGTFEIDACGDCLDPLDPLFNQACADCAGTPNGSAVIDLCGECLTPDDPLYNQTCASENELYIPNAFSPNDDGRNDLFKIFPNEATSANIDRLLVFSRWGELVYEQYNIDASATEGWWDGTFNGEALPPDVFTYFAEATFANGEVKRYEGDVTLVR
jgi:gliding motility-associated-like protein